MKATRLVFPPGRPTVSAVLDIAPDLIGPMKNHATACYPGECCGLLFGSGGLATRMQPMENLQDRLHRLDPVEHPRTSRNGFSIDGRSLQRAVDQALLQGEQLLAIFHSHIDCGAYFSDEDAGMAAPFGTPNQPGLWHVVMECWTDGVHSARAFSWDGTTFAGADLAGFGPSRV